MTRLFYNFRSFHSPFIVIKESLSFYIDCVLRVCMVIYAFCNWKLKEMYCFPKKLFFGFKSIHRCMHFKHKGFVNRHGKRKSSFHYTYTTIFGAGKESVKLKLLSREPMSFAIPTLKLTWYNNSLTRYLMVRENDWISSTRGCRLDLNQLHWTT